MSGPSKKQKMSNEGNSLNVLVAKGDFKSAEKQMKSLYKSEKKRDEMKNSIDAHKYCFIFIESNRFETADEFLLWRFKTKEERLQVKESLKTDEYVMQKILKIWGCTCDVEKCTTLLNWFFDSPEKIHQFQKKIIQDEFLIEKYWTLGQKSLKNFENFLKLCSLTSDNIKEMKVKIMRNINWYIDNFALKNGNFECVYDLIRWVYKNDKNERRRVTKNYMSSPQGFLLCLKVFESCSQRSPEHIIRLFDSWIKPSMNFDEINAHLDNCDESMYERGVIPLIKKLLRKRQKGEVVISRHLEGFVPESFTEPSWSDEEDYIEKHGDWYKKELEETNQDNERIHYGSSDVDD